MSSRSRSAELAALTAIAEQVNCTQDLDKILEGALQTTLDTVGVDAGEVFLIDGESGEITLRAQQGLSSGFITDEGMIGPGDCLCGLVAMSGHIVVAEDIASHPARSRPSCLREGFRSTICLPLRAHGEVLGLLNVQSRATRRFAAADEELLTAIGNQIGIALANARLIDAAEQRRATLDSVVNSLVDGLILVDTRGRISFANRCAADMLGLPPAALVGETPEGVDSQISSRLAAAETSSSPLKTAVTAAPAGSQLEFVFAAPVHRTLQIQPFPIYDTSRQTLGLGVLLRDITREKELDEMKSQLLSTVSHELRTPLASIKGFATTLLREDVQWDEASRREFLAIIDEESDRLAELISNLLDMSRIEAGTLSIEPEPTDLRPIVEEIASGFQILTRIHQLHVHLPASLPLVWADPRRAHQVLRNLVENAIKYSPEGGAITIDLRTLSNKVQVSVVDEGLGIAPEHLEHVFERFYQVDSASTRDVGGTGLGLSICKAIVEAHGGEIWAESQAGAGSTFRFTLCPLETAPSLLSEQAATAATTHRKSDAKEQGHG